MKRASTELPEAKRVCLCCGKIIKTNARSTYNLKENEAFGIKSTSGFFKLYETIPWCRDCATELYKSQYNMYHDYPTAMLYTCKIMDFPFIPGILKEEGTIEEIFLNYLHTIQTSKSAKVKQGFLGGDCLSERDIPLRVEADVVQGDVVKWESSNKDFDLYSKWGRNKRYTPDDYVDLEAIYHSIASQNGIITDERTGEIVDKVTEIAVIEAACNLLQSRKCRNSNNSDDAKKYYELYDKAMGSQLLRGKDVKDKQVGDILVQDIVKYCEQDDFIEPWDKKIKYNHKLDVVDWVLLHILNYVGRLTADIFNIHVSKIDKLPKEYKLNKKNDDFPEEETEVDKQFKQALKDIDNFKAMQHISDDESDEDSADLDDDSESDVALFGEED